MIAFLRSPLFRPALWKYIIFIWHCQDLSEKSIKTKCCLTDDFIFKKITCVGLFFCMIRFFYTIYALCSAHFAILSNKNAPLCRGAFGGRLILELKNKLKFILEAHAEHICVCAVFHVCIRNTFRFAVHFTAMRKNMRVARVKLPVVNFITGPE